MGGTELQDRFSRGMGVAARAAGVPYDLFRPKGMADPLRPENRVLRLPVVLDGGDPGYRRPRGYERGLRGTFDAECTRVGDYLAGPRGVVFIASLQALARPLCVLTNAVVQVLRPSGSGLPGLAGYGGVTEPVLHDVLVRWPAQLLAASAGPRGELPDDPGRSRWSLLLPPTPSPLHGSDIVQDEARRRFVVTMAERTELGWRLDLRSVGA